MSMFVVEEVEKGPTAPLKHILSHAPGLTSLPAPVTVQSPAHLLKLSTMTPVPAPSHTEVQQCHWPEDQPAIDQTELLVQSEQGQVHLPSALGNSLSHTLVRVPQMSTHPPAALFLAYSTSCLSEGPNWPSLQLAAPLLPVSTTHAHAQIRHSLHPISCPHV